VQPRTSTDKVGEFPSHLDRAGPTRGRRSCFDPRIDQVLRTGFVRQGLSPASHSFANDERMPCIAKGDGVDDEIPEQRQPGCDPEETCGARMRDRCCDARLVRRLRRVSHQDEQDDSDIRQERLKWPT
jgi:hypothetical protein